MAYPKGEMAGNETHAERRLRERVLQYQKEQGKQPKREAPKQ